MVVILREPPARAIRLKDIFGLEERFGLLEAFLAILRLAILRFADLRFVALRATLRFDFFLEDFFLAVFRLAVFRLALFLAFFFMFNSILGWTISTHTA